MLITQKNKMSQARRHTHFRMYAICAIVDFPNIVALIQNHESRNISHILFIPLVPFFPPCLFPDILKI